MKLRSSFYLARLTKRPIHWGKPMAVSIEPTTACNLGCPECPSGLKQFTRATGNLQLEMNERILRELGGSLMYVNYYFQGEPFIHHRIFDLIKQAVDRNVYTSASTNAHFISEENADKIVESGLHKLIVSVDGLTQETYSNYRKEGELEKVLQGIRNIVAAKKKSGSNFPYIIYQMLVVRQNEHEVEDAKKRAAELGVDEFQLKTAQVYDYEKGNELIPVNDAYSRYRKNADGTYSLKNRMDDHCWRMWQGCVFTWDGKIVPCCFDKDAKYTLGHLNGKTDFQSVWKGEAYRDFRQQILKSRKEVDICKNCSEGSHVHA